MTGTTENQESSDSAQRKADNHISPVIGPEATTIPKPPPADSENTAPKKKNRWTNDPPMFWVTLAGVIVVVAYTSVAAWQACLTRGQLTVLQGQLDAMIADQRPWVKIEASIAGPLTFFEPAGFAEMPMHFMLTNAGHSPAFNVRLTAWSFLLSLNHHDLEREWGERCENFKRTTLDNPARGMILFPSDQLPWNQSGIGLMPDEIKKNIIDEGGNKALDVWIYGCADYVFGGPQAHHQTGFVHFMIIGYGRTSTIEQVAGLEAQIRDLKAAGAERLFRENVSSVAPRQQLEAAIEFAREGDTLVVTKIDRLARSVRHLCEIVDRLQAKGVALRILNMNLDTNDATGKLMLQIIGSIAEFERSIMLARQLEGIAKAKAEGKYRGGIPTARAKAAQVFALVDAGKTRGEAAQALGISIRSVFRILRSREGAEKAPVAAPVARIRARPQVGT